MKIVSASVYCVNIPFLESFSHNLHERDHSDSIIVELHTDSGISGFGEGIARPYVTGENKEETVNYIQEELLPRLIETKLDKMDKHDPLGAINILLAENRNDGIIRNASRCAVELALVDALLKSKNLSLKHILPFKSTGIGYSGVIGTGTIEEIKKQAILCQDLGLKDIKMKVSEPGDIEKIDFVRGLMGSSVSIRIDANCAFNLKTAENFISSIEKHNIECIEQPLPAQNIKELTLLKEISNIPIMADESIVTLEDARELIDKKAVDMFNLRISKCGGLHNTIRIANLADSAGIGIQLGCQVGETAILSAAGYHLGNYLPNIQFKEGCYGTNLLREDISEEEMTFSYGGKIKVLSKPGLGIKVKRTFLSAYGTKQ